MLYDKTINAAFFFLAVSLKNAEFDTPGMQTGSHSRPVYWIQT